MSTSSSTTASAVITQIEEADAKIAMWDVPKWVTVGAASRLSGLTYYEVVSRTNDARVASRMAMLVDTSDLATEITTNRKAGIRAMLTKLVGADRVDRNMRSLGYDSEAVAS